MPSDENDPGDDFDLDDNEDESDDDARFISGIFNYCDRWCERCSMTSRCRVFADVGEFQKEAEEQVARNKEFWGRLERILGDSAKRINKQIEEEEARRTEQQQELENDADFDLSFQEWERRHEEARAHPLAVAAHDYGMATHQWFFKNEANDALLKSLGVSLEEPCPEPAPDAELSDPRRLQDAVEVILWYQHQIGIKLIRALDGKREEEEDPAEWRAEFPSDADGSAKVSLLGLDRSLAAWSVVREAFEQRAPDAARGEQAARKALDYMVTLDRIRRGTELNFPEARAFVRPGFDDREEENH